MPECIERDAELSLVKPDAPEDEKSAVTIATAKKTRSAHKAPSARHRRCAGGAWAVARHRRRIRRRRAGVRLCDCYKYCPKMQRENGRWY